jgi:energy-coupling factor transport system substrate-specific component
MTWQLGSTLIVAAAVVAGLSWYELRRPPAKLVALVAALAALAVAGRVLFAAIPNVQATTDVALLSGYALGPAPGFVVGAIAGLASNVFLGQGPWTPWEMLGWGGAGLFGAALAILTRRRLSRLPLAVACAVAGFAFGAWMDLFTLVAFTNGSKEGYFAISAVSLPFNIAHAVGNFLICLVFGPAFVRMLVRFRLRLSVRWRIAAPAAMALSGAVLLMLAPSALAGNRDAIRYLERAQHGDGGFGATPKAPSSQLITGWAALGLEAAGRNPLDRSEGTTAIEFLRKGAGSLRDTGELERTILALRGAGVSARKFAGRDLVSELAGRRRSDGSWNRQSNWTAFGIVSLRSAGWSPKSRAIRDSAGWLARQQNDDGGYSFATKGGGSFVDETGAALQALAAAGRARGKTAKRAVEYLRKAQNADGGYGQSAGQRSNAQSTAWAVQGLAAAAENPRRAHGGAPSPVRYLTSLQQGDGSYRYSRSSTQTPVWVTAQALAAVRLATLPYPRAPRRSTAAAAPTRDRHTRRARAAAATADRRPAHPTRANAHAARAAGAGHARTRVALRRTAEVTTPVAAKHQARKTRDIVVLVVAVVAIALGAMIFWLLR